MATGVDIDGEPWADPPCIGADQYIAGQATGALAVDLEANYTNVTPKFPVSFTATILGRDRQRVGFRGRDGGEQQPLRHASVGRFGFICGQTHRLQ
jgi:hypothetical protein